LLFFGSRKNLCWFPKKKLFFCSRKNLCCFPKKTLLVTEIL
jgi:hypothetical protein